MESSWPRKCGTMWEVTAASLLSSTHSQEPQNQILNAGYPFHSYVQAKPTSSAHKEATETLPPWTSNLSSYSLVHSELGSSSLSLLSGFPSVVPSQAPSGSKNASGCASGTGVSLLSSAILPQNLETLNLETGSDLCSVASSKARVSANCGSNSGLNNVLQDTYLNHQAVEIPKAGIDQNFSRCENGKLFPSPGLGYVHNKLCSNVCELHNSHNLGASQKVPLKADPSASCSSSILSGGCPQVFCMGLSGDLLLSNTGLLGVVCSCHGLHMSITKFSEHSGLCNINPGDAVCMESGETIARWRKSYFHKFGIRVPEDDCGWDWPEGLSVTAGQVKHGPKEASMSKSSEICNQGSTFGASAKSLSLLSNMLFPKNFHTGQKVLDEFAHNGDQRSTWEGLSSSKNNLHSVADNQMMYATSKSSVVPNLISVNGSDNICQAIPSYVDPISKNVDNFIFHPHLQGLKIHGKAIRTGRSNNSLDDGDTVSSNVELRLGQPSQQNYGPGSSMPPGLGFHQIATIEQPSKAILGQHAHQSCSRSIEERRQHNYFVHCISNSSGRMDQGKLEQSNHVHGVCSVTPNASLIGHLRGDVAKDSVIPLTLAHLKCPQDGKLQSKSINDITSCSNIMIPKLHPESPVTKPSQFGFPLFRGEAAVREFSSLMGTNKHENSEMRCAVGGLRGATELSSGSNTKAKGGMWNFGDTANGSDHGICSAVLDKSRKICQFPGIMADEPDIGKTFYYFGPPSYAADHGQHYSNISKAISNPVDWGTVLSSQSVSVGVSATNSNNIRSLTPLSKEENIGGSPYLLDENVRMISFQCTPELSNQSHAFTFSKAISEREGSKNSCGRLQVPICPLTAEKQMNRSNFAGFPNSSEIASQYVQYSNLKFCDSEKLASPTVSSAIEKFHNFSEVSRGRYCHGKEAEVCCQLASSVHSTGQLFLRIGAENITPSSDEGNCLPRLPYGCYPSDNSIAVRTNCLPRGYDREVETAVSECKDQEGGAGRIMATLLSPKLDENSTFAEKCNSLNTKKVDCNSFQWRDVPRKVIKACSLTCEERVADSVNGNIEAEVTDGTKAAAKSFEKSSPIVTSSKEQQMSAISSGSSAPVVTQTSIEFNKKESSTTDPEDAKYAGNLLFDETSGSEICWSSDDGIDSERSAEIIGFSSKINLVDGRPSNACLGKPSRSLIDELRFRDSLRLRKIKNQIHTGVHVQKKGNLIQKFGKDSTTGKRRSIKWKRTSSFSPSLQSSAHKRTSRCACDARRPSPSFKTMQMLSQSRQGRFNGHPCPVGRNFKRRRSALSSSIAPSQTKGLCRVHHLEEEKYDSEPNLNGKSDYCEGSGALGRKRLRVCGTTQVFKQFHVHTSSCTGSAIAAKFAPSNGNATLSQLANASQITQRPIVCGKYGVISNPNSLKPVKFVSLRKLLGTASSCRLAETGKVGFSPHNELNEANNNEGNGFLPESSNVRHDVNGSLHHAVSGNLNIEHSMEETRIACSLGGEEGDSLSHLTKKRRCDGNKYQAIADSCQNVQLRRKCKEVRKRSLRELITKGNYSSYVKFPTQKNIKSLSQPKNRDLYKLAEYAKEGQVSANEICNVKKSTKEDRCQYSWASDVSCCVCGSSNKDINNSLLECNSCLIKVHQACYGISEVPKVNWHCRPCKTSSKNIVCVLCGYGGGAMTRALHSRKMAKSLLQAWNIVTEASSTKPSCSKSSESQFGLLPLPNSLGESDPFLVIKPTYVEFAAQNAKLSEVSIDISSSPPPPTVVNNSITAGVLDPTVKQWVHMVCGLWTPGTRCPNDDTMSAFDVSGVCQATSNVVCSMCERPGGSCIQCRVVNCYVQFHPWCAHEKGLLQSEVEGVDNENVGFYGRCLLHAVNHQVDSGSNCIDSGNSNHGEIKFTCARVEGYNGRKQDGVHYNLPHDNRGYSKCLLVPQEQLNAWNHINKQKPCPKGPLKLSISDIEYDCRKEYARFKQSRGWRHLVVYKSGIHGLGLYTSQFISRGAMVVEYVGEIVGLRVADKREAEYQSGKKLQFKTACYFFRIDKEYIIDATRKGGIARFVNHSCLPNCVAKIISVRSEKKVVFLAERDINPGEEITYDYHFNHEDEGKKIPCYCNSKNCRRYLN